MRRFRQIEKTLANLHGSRCSGTFTFFEHFCSHLEQPRRLGNLLATNVSKWPKKEAYRGVTRQT
jgi:hypothetical protein